MEIVKPNKICSTIKLLNKIKLFRELNDLDMGAELTPGKKLLKIIIELNSCEETT